MRCPFCSARSSRVVDTRTKEQGRYIRRRRECLSCGRRFLTHETLYWAPPTVLKRDGTREPFQREKLLRSLEAACPKRPVTSKEMVEMVEIIEKQLWRLGEISTEEITTAAASTLFVRDFVSCICFLAAHRPIDHLDDLQEELNGLKGEEK